MREFRIVFVKRAGEFHRQGGPGPMSPVWEDRALGSRVPAEAQEGGGPHRPRRRGGLFTPGEVNATLSSLPHSTTADTTGGPWLNGDAGRAHGREAHGGTRSGAQGDSLGCDADNTGRGTPRSRSRGGGGGPEIQFPGVPRRAQGAGAPRRGGPEPRHDVVGAGHWSDKSHVGSATTRRRALRYAGPFCSAARTGIISRSPASTTSRASRRTSSASGSWTRQGTTSTSAAVS